MIRRMLTIDPDTKKPGLALFEGARLRFAKALPVERAVDQLKLWAPHRVLCEMPQQYGRVGDQRDFLNVARVVGRFEEVARAIGARFELVLPHAWKGQTPKKVCTLRAWEALVDEEVYGGGITLPTSAFARLEKGQGLASGEGSDVLDAIGIGLWKLGRLHARGRA